MSRQLACLACTVLLGLTLPTLAADPSLVGWWEFNEGSGTTTADSSGNNNTGTLSGPVSWAESWDGTACLSFNGPYNFVRIADSPSLNPTTGITIAAWIYPRWTGNNRIMQKSTEGSDNQYRLLKEWGDNMVVHFPGASPDRLEFPGLPPRGEWTHLAATYDGREMKVYYNGKVAGQQAASGSLTASTGPLFIGTKHSTAPAGDEFNGMLDDIRIYNRGLSEAEIKALVPAKLKAMKPDPADGATGVAIPLLRWTAGDTAMFHRVLLGTTPDLTDADIVAPRHPLTMFYSPAGLQPGVTYYWRVDEIEVNGTIHVGDLWHFRAAQKTAYDPLPGDGAMWVDPAGLTLTWTSGSTAVKHELYFGTNKDDVANGTGNTAKGTLIAAEFQTGPLTAGTAYYWRVDELEALGTKHVGDVWSFETEGGGGGGILGEYFSSLKPAGVPALTRVDQNIDFNWGTASPGPGVNEEFSVRWTGEVVVPFDGTYTFFANVQGGVRIWVNGQLVIDYWMQHHMVVEYDGTIVLKRGSYPVVIEFGDLQWSGGGAQCQVSWAGPSIAKAIMAAGPLQPPVRAQAVNPRANAVEVPQDITLMWSAGYKAKQHEVYFGDNQDAVANATTATAGVYAGRQELDQVTRDPGTLEWNKTYYWRIDEVNSTSADSPWKGAVWSFTTADSVVVDNFESYTDDEGSRIYETWTDGWTNNTGAVVGNLEAPFAEQVIVHSGRQAMPMDYNNVNDPFYSEAEREFSPTQDWTLNGVSVLTLNVRGLMDNDAGRLYVAVEDSAGKGGVVSYADDTAVNAMKWLEWKIPVSQFSGVDLTKVKKFYIGVGDRTSPAAGGAGRLYIDNIRVAKPAP